MQTAIVTGRIDFQEQCFGVFAKLNFLATLQHFYGFRQIGLQPFGTDASIDFPDLLKCLHDLATVDGLIGFGFPFKVVLNLYLVF